MQLEGNEQLLLDLARHSEHLQQEVIQKIEFLQLLQIFFGEAERVIGHKFY